jgi:2-polyprenyl-6-methoxyphenol hydroxylase-like FAD-dependent oxidoreductase
METKMTQVLIAGAGPVGLTAALELARYGISVRIIDKAAQRTDKSKALVLWSRTLELLDRSGGTAPFVAAGFKAMGVNFVAGDGKIVGHVSMDAVKSPYPYGLMLPQSDTERLLDERLQSFGVTIERQVELVHLADKGEHVEVVLRHPDGREEAVTSDWLLGCDGAHSAVRHGIGAKFEGETMNSDWMLADIHLKGYPFPDSEASVHWHKDGAFVIFPISPGRYRVIADLPMTAEAHPPTPTVAEVQAIIDRRGPPGIVAFDPIWLAGFRINGRKVADYRHGRVFLLGDAAHVHSPAGGQGMNTGMQDAFNLSWKLAAVARGLCKPAVLDSFSAERSGVGEEVLKAAARLTTVGTMKNAVAQTIRDTVGHALLGLAAFREKLADTMTEVTIGYPKSPLNGPSLGHAPKAGVRLMPTTAAPVGAGDTPKFALFGDRTAASDTVLARFSKVLEPQLRDALPAGGYCLVRPDDYVACTAKTAEEIANYLESRIVA